MPPIVPAQTSRLDAVDRRLADLTQLHAHGAVLAIRTAVAERLRTVGWTPGHDDAARVLLDYRDELHLLVDAECRLAWRRRAA